MKNWTFVILTVLVITSGCTSEKQNKTELADLNLFLETEAEIDSVFISNITQDKLFQFVRYTDTILVDSDKTINDLYNINFFSGDMRRMNQFWLNGKNLIIKGKVNNNLQLEIDTVIGSDLYYKAINFRKKYKELLQNNKEDTPVVNSFLLNSFKENNDNPFSIEIANNYFMRNVSDKENLRKIYELQINQDSTISNHLLNPYKKIEKILLESKVDLLQFHFYDTNDELTKLNLTKDKKYLIDFWFVGCAPCVQDHKIMLKEMDVLINNNVEIIGISTDQSQEVWKNYLLKNKYNWTNVREIDDYEKSAAKNMLISIFPTYILTDKNGNILYRTFSFTDIMKYLNM